MKLVDILARELKSWPEGVHKLAQSFAGMVFYQDSAQQIVPLDRMEISDDFRYAEVTRAEWQAAVDALTAEQFAELKWPDGATHFTPRQAGNSNSVFWKVENGKAVIGWPYYGGEFHSPSTIINEDHAWEYPDTIPRPTERSAEWDGVGLPPAGTVCEHKRVHEWQKVEVFAVKPNYDGSQTALFTYETGYWCGGSEPSLFRQIRTQEQIAAEAKAENMAEMLKLFESACGEGDDWDTLAGLEALYDANYRKQVAP